MYIEKKLWKQHKLNNTQLKEQKYFISCNKNIKYTNYDTKIGSDEQCWGYYINYDFKK